MYEYKAIIKKVYDGDTVTLDIDVGFDVWIKNQRVRLLYINAPEIRGEERPEGLISKQRLLELIPIGSDVIIKTKRDRKGKYGRYLVEIFPLDSEISCNEILLNENLAKPYN